MSVALLRLHGDQRVLSDSLLSVKILCRIGKMQDGNVDASQSKGNPFVLTCGPCGPSPPVLRATAEADVHAYGRLTPLGGGGSCDHMVPGQMEALPVEDRPPQASFSPAFELCCPFS